MKAKLEIGIEKLRLPLCLMVMAIHSKPIGYDSIILSRSVVDFLGSSLAGVAVPCFFFISAYLYGSRHQSLSVSEYVGLLSKKARTLLIPYLLWNVIALLISEVVNMTPLSAYTSGGYEFSTVSALFRDLWLQPWLEPLWFIRNLILFFILSPIVVYSIRGLKLCGVIAWFVIEYISPGVAELAGIGYFALGIYTATELDNKKISLFLRCRWLIVVFVGWAIVKLFATNSVVWDLINEIAVVCGIAGLFGMSGVGVRRQNNIGPSCIFFMYAFHGIVAPYVIKSIALLITPSTAFGYIAEYFICFALIVVISLAAYVIMNQLMPSVVKVITGGRKPISPGA